METFDIDTQAVREVRPPPVAYAAGRLNPPAEYTASAPPRPRPSIGSNLLLRAYALLRVLGAAGILLVGGGALLGASVLVFRTIAFA